MTFYIPFSWNIDWISMLPNMTCFLLFFVLHCLLYRNWEMHLHEWFKFLYWDVDQLSKYYEIFYITCRGEFRSVEWHETGFWIWHKKWCSRYAPDEEQNDLRKSSEMQTWSFVNIEISFMYMYIHNHIADANKVLVEK